jgi:hypothetical protein
MPKMIKPANNTSHPPPILRTIWNWAKFAVWLPWFVLTFPWQIRKAYQQVMAAINIQDDLKIDEDLISGFRQGCQPTRANSKKPSEKTFAA